MPTILGKAIASCHRRTGYTLALQNSSDSGYLRLRIVLGYQYRCTYGVGHCLVITQRMRISHRDCQSGNPYVATHPRTYDLLRKYPHVAFRPSSEGNIHFYTSPQSYLGPSITTVTLPINIEILKGSPFYFQRLHNIPERRTRIWTSGLYTSILYLD